ncbi:Protein kinase domain-containing protein [Psidium guajava]|nr:Protein kinase domain-containing protein [Psidium guajava]
MKPRLWAIGLLAVVMISACCRVESKCPKTCDLALASYYVWSGTNLSSISQVLSASVADIVSYNSRDTVPNQDSVLAGFRINVPFSCDCVRDEFLGHVFKYSVGVGDTYDRVAQLYYSNLTTASWLQAFNSYPATNIPDTGELNVTVNCSCGNSAVSKDYGLFITYPLREGDTLESVAGDANLTTDLVQRYNPGVNFSQGSGLVYIPGKDASGKFPALNPRLIFDFFIAGLPVGAIVGIAAAAVVVLLFLAFCLYARIYQKKKVKEAILLTGSDELSSEMQNVLVIDSAKPSESTGPAGGASTRLTGITVDKSVEFSYEELAKATDNFSLANKIGEGGFGAVYYAELRGEKAAIKKMDMQASKEFLAELKVLTHVHHLNLVRLIGYCVEGSLFLVYEYIENGNLSQHLRGSDREPLPWFTRVQIALDSARGLEYIHEHTVPVYIHRDIKTANILIDKNFHAKVADFGLTKLTEVGSGSLPTRLVGTFGYMPPEYAQYGNVSAKVDVYAFGVVLYELVSAKEAIVKANGSIAESKGLVALFEEVLNQPDPKEDLCKLVDPRLGENYPLDSVRKMAQLAKACTQENPQLRPSMRSIVVALMTLSSSTEDWDVGSFYENHALVNLMSGR